MGRRLLECLDASGVGCGSFNGSYFHVAPLGLGIQDRAGDQLGDVVAVGAGVGSCTHSVLSWLVINGLRATFQANEKPPDQVGGSVAT